VTVEGARERPLLRAYAILAQMLSLAGARRPRRRRPTVGIPVPFLADKVLSDLPYHERLLRHPHALFGLVLADPRSPGSARRRIASELLPELLPALLAQAPKRLGKAIVVRSRSPRQRLGMTSTLLAKGRCEAVGPGVRSLAFVSVCLNPATELGMAVKIQGD